MFLHVLYIVRPSWRPPMLSQVYGELVAETPDTITIAYNIAGTTGTITVAKADVHTRSETKLGAAEVERKAMAFGASMRGGN